MSRIDWTRLPPLSALRAFEATARLQGYSAAARSLNVTPAAIAQQVRKLESHIGASLVRREGRGLVLTPSGRRLSGHLRDAFAQIAEGIDEVHRQEAARGVRVSTTQFFVDAVILPNLGDFWTRYPGVEVAFAPDGNREPVDLDTYDICVRAAPSADAWIGHGSRRLVDSPFVACAAPSLLETAGHDPAQLPWLYDPNIEEVFQRFIRQAGLDPETIRVVDTGSPHLEIEAAVAGYGVSVSTEILIRPHLADGRLVLLDTGAQMLTRYYAVHRKGHLREPVAHFLDWLSDLCHGYQAR